MSGMISIARECFAKIDDSSRGTIPLTDQLMSGIAMFHFKFPSLLQFDKAKRHDATEKSLKNLYGIKRVPSDTWFRERLDNFEYKKLRPLYRYILRILQRRKILQKFRYLDDHYLVALDGTNHHSSKKVHCPMGSFT